MTNNVAILGGAALPVGKWQGSSEDETQHLEHELLAKLVMDAMEDAGLEKSDIRWKTPGWKNPIFRH